MKQWEVLLKLCGANRTHYGQHGSYFTWHVVQADTEKLAREWAKDDYLDTVPGAKVILAQPLGTRNSMAKPDKSPREIVKIRLDHTVNGVKIPRGTYVEVVSRALGDIEILHKGQHLLVPSRVVRTKYERRKV